LPDARRTLALVGWYLMLPPFDDRFLPNEHAPLSRWQIENSFDSADNCEQNRHDFFKDGMRLMKGKKSVQDTRLGIQFPMRSVLRRRCT
jgi:hypothetical protein